MTSFIDFIRDRHFDQYVGEESHRDDDFDIWKEEITPEAYGAFFADYIGPLSYKSLGHIAYELQQSQS